MATVVIKTNALQVTDALLNDLGFLVPNSAGTVSFDTITDYDWVVKLQNSKDVYTYLTDDAFGANDSTLILNDGGSDLAQADALNWLYTIVLPDGDADYGVLKTNAAGEVYEDIDFAAGATVTGLTLGGNADAGNFTINNLADAVSSAQPATYGQLQAQAVLQKVWKELVLSSSQFDSTNDCLAQALPFWMLAQPVDGDFLTVRDGVTTRIYEFDDNASITGDVTVTIGATVAITMANLATAISGDGSGLWDGDASTGLGSLFVGTVVVISRRNQASASHTDRVYGTFATASNAKYVNFNGLTDYSSSTVATVPSADPAVKTFGFGRITSALIPNETHKTRAENKEYIWDDDGGAWQDQGSAYTHGDRGTDGSTSQHDADQIDVEGTYPYISGTPTTLEATISSINANFSSAAYGGKQWLFSTTVKIPSSGTSFLGYSGNLLSSSVPLRILRSGTLKSAWMNTDLIDASRAYKLSIQTSSTIDGIYSEVALLAFGTSVRSAVTTALAVALTAGHFLRVAVIRTSGSGSSDFTNVGAMVEFIDS